MEPALRSDTDGTLDLSADHLSQMTNAELLQAVRVLECRDAEPCAIEHDHRQYLERQELERLVLLAARLHRRPRANSAAGSSHGGAGDMLDLAGVRGETQHHA